jgi:hypothetical protein
MDAGSQLAQRAAAVLFTTRFPRLGPLVGAGAAVMIVMAALPGPDGPGSIREAEAGDCPKGMVSIKGEFCIDRFEAATDEIFSPRKGKKAPKVKRRHSPFEPVDGVHVMAVSEKGRIPQGYISRNQAEEACINAGKRLCTDDEWQEACRGKSPTVYPYGDDHVEGYCNDKGVSSFNLIFGPGNNEPPEQAAYTRENMNDPRLNKMDGTVARTGSFPKCKNSFKVHDMVGNLHEWTADPKGTFRGGYYLDTSINGKGCDYRTGAHDAKYHDYSTGFRCCFGGKEQKKTDLVLKARAATDKARKAAKSDEAERKESKDSKKKTAKKKATKKKEEG